MSEPIVIDQLTAEIVGAEQALGPWYVSGENVPAVGAETAPVRRAEGLALRRVSDDEALAFDAAEALREWHRHYAECGRAGEALDLRYVRTLVTRVVSERTEPDGISAWVRIDAGKRPAEATIREYRASARDLLIWMAMRGLSPADAGAEELKSYKAFLQADGAAVEMERMRAAWYGREPRIAYGMDWRGPVLWLAWREYRRASIEAGKAEQIGKRAARVMDRARELAGTWLATVRATLATFATSPRRALHESYGDDTVALRITMARSFYKMALSRQAVYQNPLIEIKVGKGATSRSQKIMSRFFSDKEVLAILELCDEERVHTPRDKAAAARDTAMIRLARNQGLRISEISNLDQDDYNETAGEFGTLTLRHAKGNKTRTVLLTEKTRRSLERWLQYRALLNGAEAAVFVTLNWGHRDGTAEPGSRITTRAIRDMFDEKQKALGLKRAGRSVHGLRHSYATRALMEDESQLISLSLSMGHSSPTITMGYAEVSQLLTKNPAKLGEI